MTGPTVRVPLTAAEWAEILDASGMKEESEQERPEPVRTPEQEASYEAYIQAAVDRAPPLPDDQVEWLAALLRPDVTIAHDPTGGARC